MEAHTKEEIESALKAEARIIGVNNRNLRTFEVDIRNCIALRSLIPKDIPYVAESGIQTREDIALLEEAKVDAVLIGEALMKSADKKAMLAYFKGEKKSLMSEGVRMVTIKICGLTREQDIDAVNIALPDYIGFVFAETREELTKKSKNTEGS